MVSSDFSSILSSALDVSLLLITCYEYTRGNALTSLSVGGIKIGSRETGSGAANATIHPEAEDVNRQRAWQTPEWSGLRPVQMLPSLPLGLFPPKIFGVVYLNLFLSHCYGGQMYVFRVLSSYSLIWTTLRFWFLTNGLVYRAPNCSVTPSQANFYAMLPPIY